MRKAIWLLLVVVLATGLPAGAQGKSSLVAVVNASGQLIVSSGDGGFRWIVTNPGETLAGDYGWAGTRLFFAVQGGGDNSLRVADANGQQISEVGRLPGTLLSLSPKGDYVFYQQNDGSYGIEAVSAGTVALTLSNDAGARYSGLWSDAAPLVAYWGYSGNSVLAVTDAANQQTITLDSGRSAPITPLAWRPGTAQLIYRDASGSVRIADVSCLQSGCGASPLDSGTALLPADTSDVQTDGIWVYYHSGESVGAVNLSCVAADSCLNSAVSLGTNAAPQTAVYVAGGTLVYTAYANNANDPNDRDLRAINLSCLSNPSSCAAQTVLTGAVAGPVSADGGFAVAQLPGDLEVVNLSSGATANLSDHNVPLSAAHWQS